MGLGRARTMGAKALLIHPSHQGVCWRHDTEDSCVTPGDLPLSWFFFNQVSDPISESEMGSDAEAGVGERHGT
jgi:hypothetical protein